MNCLDAACGNLILKFGIAAIAAVAVFAFLAYRAKRSRKASKLDLIVSAMLLGTFTFGMINEGVVTQEDKEEYRGAIARTAAERTAMASILLPEGRDMASLETSPSATGDDAAALAKKSSHDADSSGTGQNLRDAQQGIADSDYEAGFVLAEVRTSEVHDFSAPTNAVWHRDWLDHGGIGDNFRLEFGGLSFPFGTNAISALTVFQRGLMRPRTVDAASFIAPLQAWLGAVPECSHSLLPEMSRPSGFWHCFTPSNSVVMTWRNFLLGRDALHPVTLQAELFEDGCAEFRYDLSQAGAETISNIVAGIRCDSLGTTLDSLDANVTTIRWQRLNPEDVANPDPDNDGISTCDEIFVYHTNPYNADSDYDGVSDYDEINVHNSDPNNAHSVSQLYCDSFALVLGDEDPFACPEGSTNTIYEHIVYTGTTNAPFAYPQSSEDGAVLEITVSGTGTGEMILGDRVIPLVAPPQLRSGAATCRLFENVGYGVKKQLRFRKPAGLEAALHSDEMLIGELPSLTRWKGWIAFPHTDATIPCIHDLASCGKTVSLVHGEEFPGLTATWESEAQGVAIANVPPVSAEIYGRFPKTQTRTISYTIGHPDYQSGQTTFTQTLRFCPQIEEEDVPPGANDGNGGPAPEPDDSQFEEASEEWLNGEDVTTEAESAAEYARVAALSSAAGVLQLHGTVGREDVITLEVPEGEPPRCCDCPDHARSNYVAVAWKSPRLKVVDNAEEDFWISHNDVQIAVRGRHPSREPLGDGVLFVTNAVPSLGRAYTVLGLDIEKPSEPSLAAYNAMNASFGFPVAINTNMDSAASLQLRSDVLLTNGVVRLALENCTGEFEIWVPERTYMDGSSGVLTLVTIPAEKVLDSAENAERHYTMRQWRQLMSRFARSRELDVLVLSSATGRCDLVMSYALDHGGAAIRSSARQRITSVRPPMLPDYNHDGRIDAVDVSCCTAALPYRFWTNEDYCRGDDVVTFLAENTLKPLNCSDGVVNGTLDLVNFFPIALDLSAFRNHWDASGIAYSIGFEYGNDVRLKGCFVDCPWSSVGNLQTNAMTTVGGEPLSSAPLTGIGASSAIPGAALDAFSADSGVLFAEAVCENYGNLVLKVLIGDDVYYKASLPMRLLPVRRMYDWHNYRAESGGVTNRPTTAVASADRPYLPENAKKLFFLHGVFVNEDEAQLWGDALFKRFWHAGCHIEFHNVDWRSDIGAAGNYQQNASNAFEIASVIAADLNAVQGEKVVMAHSLGNMVVSSMIQDHGLQVSKYFMCDSAVPAEAYDTSLAPTNLLVHADWNEYPAKARANEWYHCFEDDPEDDRNKLTWAGRFPDVAQHAVVFYSTGDHVLEMVKTNDVGLLVGYENSAQMFERYSWHKQEMRKGRKSSNPLVLNTGATDWSGWSFREYLGGYNIIQPTNAWLMSMSELKTNTVFKVYPESMNTNSIPRIVLDAHLTQGIPARTPAAGAIKWGGQEMDKVRFDLNSTNVTENGIARPNGWPTRYISGIFLGTDWEDRWLHSDMKNISYYYVYKFYEKLKETGGLE